MMIILKAQKYKKYRNPSQFAVAQRRQSHRESQPRRCEGCLFGDDAIGGVCCHFSAKIRL